MIKTFTFQRKIPLSVCLVLLVMIPIKNQAQSVKRQCISSYGAVAVTDGLSLNQTAGQVFNTSATSESNISVLQGFQQPNTFTIQEVNSPVLKSLNLTVYPNPASYSVTLKSEKEIELSLIRVTDINGKEILSEKVSNLLLHSINCESWPTGIYLIQVYDASQNAKTLILTISK